MDNLTFQRIRHYCALCFCPKDWTTAKWADFFADCLKLLVLDEEAKAKAIEELKKTYDCKESTILATLDFQKDYKMLSA